LDAAMTNCQLILCEKTAHFAPAVRRELGGKLPPIVETRSIGASEAALAESPESLVVVDATAANLESAVEFLTGLGRRYPRAAAVALLTVESEAAETLLAEAGAIAVFHSVLDAPALARLAERKFATALSSDLSRQDLLTPQEFIAERLPWAAHATGDR